MNNTTKERFIGKIKSAHTILKGFITEKCVVLRIEEPKKHKEIYLEPEELLMLYNDSLKIRQGKVGLLIDEAIMPKFSEEQREIIFYCRQVMGPGMFFKPHDLVDDESFKYWAQQYAAHEIGYCYDTVDTLQEFFRLLYGEEKKIFSGCPVRVSVSTGEPKFTVLRVTCQTHKDSILQTQKWRVIIEKHSDLRPEFDKVSGVHIDLTDNQYWFFLKLARHEVLANFPES